MLNLGDQTSEVLDGKIGFRFLVRPKPILHESRLGFVIRVIEANGLSHPRQLSTVLINGALKNPWNSLLERLELHIEDTSDLIGPLPSYWDVVVPDEHIGLVEFNQKYYRWCPLCLSDSVHYHGSWSLKLFCVCETHGCKLQERCPNCLKLQRLERVSLNKCGDCGAFLQNSVIESVSPMMATLQHSLMAKLTRVEGEIFPQLDINACLRLTRYLGQYTEISQPRRPGQIAGLHDIVIAESAMANVAHLLMDWPANFEKLLLAIQTQQASSPSVRRTFGSLYHVLYFNLHEESFQFLRDAFEHYLSEHWWGLVCKRNRSFRKQTIASHPRLTIDQAAAQSGVAPAVIKHLSQASLIDMHETTLSSGRKTYSVHQKDLSHIALLANVGMNISQASIYLGIAEKRVRELISANIIQPLVSRARSKSASWLIPRQQLEQLSFKASLSIQHDLVTLSWIVRYWRLRKGEFVALIKALLAHEFEILGLAEGKVMLGEVLFNPLQVKNWMLMYRATADQTLSVDEAARFLGVKQQVAYQLVRTGLLKSVKEYAAGQRIHKSNLQSFQKNYISLAEIAIQQKISPRAALKAMKIKPACGPTIDGCRQYFFKRNTAL